MSVKNVCHNGNLVATVDGYVHDDGTTAVLLSPYAKGITLNLHWSPAQARTVAAWLIAAADATEAKAAVHRPHCGRCDRCGFEMGDDPAQCRVDSCSMRPLPPYRQTCAGCGSPFETSPCIAEGGCKNNGQFDGRCYFHRAPPDGQDVGKVRATNNTERARRYREHNPDVPVVEGLEAKILQLVESGAGKLEMDAWHKCGTTHCRAGWAVHLAGEAGYALENKLGGTQAAGARIYRASVGYAPHFFEPSNERALEDIRRCAGEQTGARDVGKVGP